MLSTPLETVYDKRLRCISPDRVAAMLHMPLVELARIADVHRNTFARAPSSPKVQTRLGEMMRILTEASAMMGDDLAKAVIWFRHQPLSGFDGQTAGELVAAGHAQVVVTYLAMLRDGVYA
jgi:uncharacterized protein (DUF2384 family)